MGSGQSQNSSKSPGEHPFSLDLFHYYACGWLACMCEHFLHASGWLCVTMRVLGTKLKSHCKNSRCS